MPKMYQKKKKFSGTVLAIWTNNKAQKCTENAALNHRKHLNIANNFFYLKKDYYVSFLILYKRSI